MKMIVASTLVSLSLLSLPAYSALTAPPSTAETLAEGGSNAGNGGSKIILDFKTFGAKFQIFLATPEGQALFPDVDPTIYADALDKAHFEVVRKAIRDKEGHLVTARNLDLAGQSLIQIHRRSWRKDSAKPITALRTTVHEFFGIGKIGGEEERLNYRLTLRITPEVAYAILIGPKRTTDSAPNPLLANETVQAEAEAKLENDRAAAAQALRDEQAAIANERSEEMKEELRQRFQARIDLASVKTMKCVERLVKKRLGGKYAVDYAASILVELRAVRKNAESESDDFSAFQKPAEHCLKIAATLSPEKTSHEEMLAHTRKAPSGTSAAATMRLLRQLIYPSLAYCRNTRLTATAGFLFNGTVGISAADCTMSNGVRWLSVGPQIGAGIGFGASVEYARAETNGETEYEEKDNDGATAIGGSPVILSGTMSFEHVVAVVDTNTWTAMLNAAGIVNSDGKDPGHFRHHPYKPVDPATQSHFHGVGMAANMASLQGGLHIPVLKMKRNWGFVLKQL